MGLDIKIPIGLMFSILGIILTVHGIITGGDTQMYEQSLGVNINLWSGLSMVGWRRGRFGLHPRVTLLSRGP